MAPANFAIEMAVSLIWKAKSRACPVPPYLTVAYAGRFLCRRATVIVPAARAVCRISYEQDEQRVRNTLSRR